MEDGYQIADFYSLQKIINSTTVKIRRFLKKEDIRNGDKKIAIVCTGISGLLVAPNVASKLGIPCVIVRKSDFETSHGYPVSILGAKEHKPQLKHNDLSYRTKKVRNIDKYDFIVIDDFVCSGATLEMLNTFCEDRVIAMFCHCRDYQDSYELPSGRFLSLYGSRPKIVSRF